LGKFKLEIHEGEFGGDSGQSRAGQSRCEVEEQSIMSKNIRSLVLLFLTVLWEHGKK